MKKTTIILFLTLIISGCTYTENTDKSKATKSSQQPTDKPAMDCRMRDFTMEYMQSIVDGREINYEITQEYIDELNSVPHCKDFCEEQLNYSKKYEDWFAENSLRETCKSVGVILPE